MKTRFTWLGIVAACIFILTALFIGCNGDLKDVVLYRGQVVYINTTTPFADLTVKVTDGQNTHCQTQTDAGGEFSLKVRVNEIDGSYYLLAGDSTCVPKKVSLGGYGQAEVDLGVIEVEGPALPTVKTTPLTEVTADGATLGGEVMTDGRMAVTARGICYGTEQQPTVDGVHTTDGSGLGAFTTTLKNLEHNTIYYARAYATNKMGTAYGEQVKFTTELGLPLITTDSVYRITAHSAKCKGHVESDGGYAVSKKGTCWSRQPDPTVDDDCTNDGSGTGEFTSSLNNLLENTTYYVRTYATNATATVYGEQIIITTLDGLAVVKTDSINNVTATGFTAFGTVVSDCDLPVTARGFCYSTTQYPTIEDEHTTVGKGLGSYMGNIRNLNLGMTYYVRAYATNETGTSYGKQISVTTQDGLPVVKTTTATSTATTISMQGEVIETWGYNVTERGFVYSQQNAQPTTDDLKVNAGKGTGVFNFTIQNLEPESQYYLRAYAINENGTSYGNTIRVMTTDGKASVSLGTITDITAQSASSLISVTKLGGASNLQSCGLCWSTDANPTINDSIVVANGKQLNTNYTCIMSMLVPNTTYYVRAYATTDVATNYSTQKSFKTKDGLPQVTTTEITASGGAVITGGNVISDGGFPILERGVCYGSFPNPDLSSTYSHTSDGEGIGYYTSNLGTSLSGTIYVRAYATNVNGTSYGAQISVDATYLILPSFSYGGHTYKVAPTASTVMNLSDAINYCNNLELCGYNDWFLPSKEVLSFMYTLKNQIGGFNYWVFWSSTKDCTNVACSQYYSNAINFSDGSLVYKLSGYDGKNHVRPIRKDD